MPTPVVLDSFGGLVSAGRPDNLPEGASPRTNDTDFLIGRILQRPGTQSVYAGGPNNCDFNGIVSANLDESDLTTLLLDAIGNIWQEDVTNNPGVLAGTIIPPVPAGSFMKGVDADGTAYMAFSNLTQGTSQPMQYNGRWADRITQVGPGAAPVFTPSASGAVSAPITSITQPSANTGTFVLSWSAGAGTTDAGNNVTIFYSTSAQNTVLANAIAAGYPVYVYVTGSLIGAENGTWQVTGLGFGPPPGSGTNYYYFTYTVAQSGTNNGSQTGVSWEISQATVVTSAAVPQLVNGGEVSLTGVSNPSWDGVFNLVGTLNSGAYTISQTQFTAGTPGTAVYTWSLVSGVAPTVGQMVTITNTLNADGILNVANAVITAVTGGTQTGTFSVAITGSTSYATVVEEGLATTAGTTFLIDPGAALAGSTQNPIFGAGSGGTLSVVGATIANTFPIGAGTRQGVVFFITRNGAVTKPSPPVIFTVPQGSNFITASQVPLGPANVVARGLAFTEAGSNGIPGANFYTYDVPVSFTLDGVTYTASALIIPDNVTTTANFTFSDQVLLAADEIDIPGNDYFNLIELGDPVWMFQYADRMLYGLCQTKIQNFLNLSFDGGPPSGVPLGWTEFSANVPSGTSVSTTTSPSWGNALLLANASGATWNNGQVLYQDAYQDAYNVGIIQPNTAYSIRIIGRSLVSGNQKVEFNLQSLSSGTWGTDYAISLFTFNLGNLVTQTSLLTGATGIPIIPSDLQLVVNVDSITAGASVEIDRIDIFPTNRPVDTTTIWCSYADKFESVDGVTGTLGVGADNAQPAQGAYQLIEQLCVEKSGSISITQDSPNYEPNDWTVKTITGAGTLGPNSFDSSDTDGEEWALTANRSGVYYFNGGRSAPISREIQGAGGSSSVWEMIYWAAASKIWLRNDLVNRKFYIGVPMITPNFWLPDASASATPNSPNVILMCNYSGCPSGEELEASAPVHVTMFGDLKALDMRRKWSIWQIPSPVAEFVTRQDGFTQELFLCNGIASGKVYQLVPGAPSGGQNTDDGAAIPWKYTTYGFTGAKQGQQNPMIGALRKIWLYLSCYMEGAGQVTGKLYQNTLGATYPFTIPLPFTLSYPAQNNQERVLEISGERVFVEFSAMGTGGYAEISTLTLDGEADKWSPHRGVAQ